MTFHLKLEKIIAIKDSEKTEALANYNQAVSEFEVVADKLYHYLKQKEELENKQTDKLNVGLTVQDIRQYQEFILNLEKFVSHYQTLVIQAREKMQKLQNELVDKNIEVKKYEKLQEKGLQVFHQARKEDESKRMDEISLQLFMNRRN